MVNFASLQELNADAQDDLKLELFLLSSDYPENLDQTSYQQDTTMISSVRLSRSGDLKLMTHVQLPKTANTTLMHHSNMVKR